MQNGKKIYEQRLKEFNANHKGNDPYPENDGRFELVRTMRAYNRTVDGAYFPQRLENFSPYREDHKYRNLIQAERDIISGIEQTEPITRTPLKKAEQLLQYRLEQALDSLDDKIYIIRTVTGIGKSWRIKDLDDVTIAFPTNDLKEELYGERNVPATAVMTPDLPTFSNHLINDKLQRLYTLGLGKQAHQLLWDIKKGARGNSHDQYLARTYIDDSKAARRSIHTVFTTHDRAMHTSFGHDTIIYDEDPIDSLLNVDTLRIADLKKIEKHANMFGDKELSILDLQRYLEDVEEDRILSLPSRFEVGINSHLVGMLYARDIQSNIMEFLESDYFYKDPNDRDKIHFINTSSFPEDNKIIIMSATIPTFIYKKLFGERVVEVDISDVAQQGTVTQYTDYSYSRNSLSKRIEEANEKTKGHPTITFKSFNDSIESASPKMWFQNCSGYNGYSGMDINVLGTPHKHNAQYYLIGKVIGANVDKFNREFGMQTVTRGGFRYSFNTFKNEDLREIQLSLIEGELLQAAGRARVIREDAEVAIYSNLPLRITDRFEPAIKRDYQASSEAPRK